jgi:hypothetical protein
MADGSFFAGVHSGVRMPETVMNSGPLPPLEPGGLPHGLDGTPDARINYGSSLLGDIAPYAYGGPSRLSTQSSYINIPNRIQKVVPLLWLPDPSHEQPRFMLSHAVDDGDVAFALRDVHMKCVEDAKTLERSYTHRNYHPFVNLATVNYLLAGLQIELQDGAHDALPPSWRALAASVMVTRNPRADARTVIQNVTRGLPPFNADDTRDTVLQLIESVFRPFGVAHGSERQGGGHEAGGGPVTWASSFVTTLYIDGQVRNLANLWRGCDVSAGEYLVFALRRKPLPRQYTLNHYHKATVRKAFTEAQRAVLGRTQEVWQLVPDVTGSAAFDPREPHWRVAMAHVSAAAYASAETFADDAALLSGALLEACFQPVFLADSDWLTAPLGPVLPAGGSGTVPAATLPQPAPPNPSPSPQPLPNPSLPPPPQPQQNLPSLPQNPSPAVQPSPQASAAASAEPDFMKYLPLFALKRSKLEIPSEVDTETARAARAALSSRASETETKQFDPCKLQNIIEENQAPWLLGKSDTFRTMYAANDLRTQEVLFHSLTADMHGFDAEPCVVEWGNEVNTTDALIMKTRHTRLFQSLTRIFTVWAEDMGTESVRPEITALIEKFGDSVEKDITGPGYINQAAFTIAERLPALMKPSSDERPAWLAEYGLWREVASRWARHRAVDAGDGEEKTAAREALRKWNMIGATVPETQEVFNVTEDTDLRARPCVPDYKRYAAALLGRPAARAVAPAAAAVAGTVAVDAMAVDAPAADAPAAPAVRKAARKRAAAASVLGAGPEAGAATLGDVL